MTGESADQRRISPAARVLIAVITWPWTFTTVYAAWLAGIALWGAWGIGTTVFGLPVITVLVLMSLTAQRRARIRALTDTCPNCGYAPDGDGTVGLYRHPALGSFWLCAKHIDEMRDWKRWHAAAFKVVE
jgi:hypothetical protein